MAQPNFDMGVSGPGAIARITLSDFLRRAARRHPSRIALFDGEREITFAAFDALVNRLANGILGAGCIAGDRIAIIGQNSIEYAAIIWALMRVNMVAVPINTMLGKQDNDYILKHAGVSRGFVDQDALEAANQGAILDEMGVPVWTVSAGMPDFDNQAETEPETDIENDDIAVIIYTSGTTSRPKGACHSHLSLTMATMSNIIEWRLGREDRVTIQLPLFHCGGQSLMFAHLLVGGAGVLMQGFDPGQMLREIDERRITMCVGLPMMYAQMLDHPDRARYSTASLRHNIYTMAVMAEPLMRRLLTEFSDTFYLTSGQTEMFPMTTISQPDRQTARFGNYWGESAMINDTVIMDDDGTILPTGMIGELCHRGANVMSGYYRDPDATAEVRQYGWHHTGDLALIDEHGEVLFIDRKKDMIKSGGENIPSIRIEETLLAIEGVIAAAVIGLPHPHWGEAVTGFVQIAPGSTLSEQEIIDAARERLGSVQAPKRIVFLDKFPRTGTGKLRKIELRTSHADLYS